MVIDIDGKYFFDVIFDVGIIVFSYIGFVFKEVDFGVFNVVDVMFELDVIGLEDVVVVGYVFVKCKNFIGLVQLIDGGDVVVEAGVIVQFGICCVVGVVVQQLSGVFGVGYNICVCGVIFIIVSNELFFVVDGVLVVFISFLDEDCNGIGGQNINFLVDFNFVEIELIEVLKDVFIIVIYGFCVVNGVVLIIIKCGFQGKMKVDFNVFYGFNEFIKIIFVVNNVQYCEYVIVLFGIDQLGWIVDDNSNDWQNLILQCNFIQQYGVNVIGGDCKMKFFMGMNYDDNQGILNGIQFICYFGCLNLDYQVFDCFKMFMNLGFICFINKLIQNDNNIYGVIFILILLFFIILIFNFDGFYGFVFGLENLIVVIEEYEYYICFNCVIGNVEVIYFLMDNLFVLVKFGLDVNLVVESVFLFFILQQFV